MSDAVHMRYRRLHVCPFMPDGNVDMPVVFTKFDMKREASVGYTATLYIPPLC